MRTFSMLTIGALALSLTACGNDDISDTTASETNAENTMQAAEEGGAMLPEGAGEAMAPAAEGAATDSAEDAGAVDQSVQDALAEAEREADAAAE
jgi:hypothetical protein